MFFQNLYDASRTFQYDYIYIDALFVSFWVLILIKNKKWSALKAGIITGFLVYLIDAIWWWNMPAGPDFPPGTYIREYWIGGVQMPHPLGNYFLLKFGCDFMMTISYSLFAFSWLWIMFENIEKKNIKEVTFYSIFYFGAWMLTPFLSFLLDIDNSIVYTVRHMNSQFIIWIINVCAGYSILVLIYGTNKFKSKNPKVIGYVFIIGLMESFYMEFPLFIYGIRPTSIPFLIYEVFFLFNQGAPYLYILWDKVIPIGKEKIFSSNKKSLI